MLADFSIKANKADIIARLQKDILPLQGFKATLNSTSMDVGLGPIKNAFPNATFPLGAIHEFICNGGVLQVKPKYNVNRFYCYS